MTQFNVDDLKSLERFYRAHLINSLSGLKQAHLIGTQNKEGIHNLALFSSVVHLGADPALIGYIQRPITDYSHTYKNIMHHKTYTINMVTQAMHERAHQTSAKFDDGISEFEACHFTPQHIPGFHAPFVKESPIKLGLELVEALPIQHNQTTLMIGKLVYIEINDDLLESDGHIDLYAAQPAVVSGLDTYHTVQQGNRYAYAKPVILK